MPEAKAGNLPIKMNPRVLIVILAIAALIFLFVADVISPIRLFDIVLLQPMLNFLAITSKYFFGSFGLAIVVLTILIRVLTLPLTMKQLRSTKAMQELQPKLKELNKKYGKDKQRIGEETMKLYKEHGVNPVGCAVPMLIQFPIWIALYQAVIQGLGYAPENLLGLSRQLYSLSLIQEQVPLSSHFLWLDLGSGDMVMAFLVGLSMWVLQKMSTQPSGDAQQQSMNFMMQWGMPLLFGFMSITFPSGLSLYWVLTNVISIVIQYRVTGWGSLKAPSLTGLKERLPWVAGGPAGTAGVPEKVKSSSAVASDPEEAAGGGATAGSEAVSGGDGSSRRKKVSHGKHRDKRKVRRRSG